MKIGKSNNLEALVEEMIAASKASPNSWTTLKNGSRVYTCTRIVPAHVPTLGEVFNDSKIEFRSRPTYDSSKFYFTDI